MSNLKEQIKRIEVSQSIHTKLLSELLSIVKNQCSPINEPNESKKIREDTSKQVTTTIEHQSDEERLRELNRRLDLFF